MLKDCGFLITEDGKPNNEAIGIIRKSGFNGPLYFSSSVNPNEVKGKPVFCMPEMEPLAMLAWMFHGIDVYMVDVNQKSIKQGRRLKQPCSSEPKQPDVGGR